MWEIEELTHHVLEVSFQGIRVGCVCVLQWHQYVVKLELMSCNVSSYN